MQTSKEVGENKACPFSEDNTIFPLRLFGFSTEPHGCGSSHPLCLRFPLFLQLDLLPHRGVDCELKDFVDALCLFAAAFDVNSSHTLRDGLALFWCNGREALSFEQVDTRALRPEVRFEPDEDKRGGGTKVEHFGVPLRLCQGICNRMEALWRTLSITFSNELGQSMAKQTKRRSVSG